MTYLSAMMMALSLLGETAGSSPLQFRAVDADTGMPVPDVEVRQLPVPWQIELMIPFRKSRFERKARMTDDDGLVTFDESLRCTYFFKVPGYLPVDVRRGWFGLKGYEEPFQRGNDLETVDGILVVPLRKYKGSPD